MKIALLTTDCDLWGLGIRLISSVLHQAGHSTRLIFLPSESRSYPPRVLEEIKELVQSTDLVGISCYSKGSDRARQLATYFRGRTGPIVWGGLHATLNPGECAEAADIVCRGEGEGTIVELAEVLESGGEWEHLQNLAYIKQGQLVVNPVRPPVSDLDELPLWDFERQDEFHLTEGRVMQAPRGPEQSFRGQVPAIGSRGCAYHCTYCCNRQLKGLYAGKGKYVRRMSVARYVEQIETLYKRHFPEATSVYLLDEDFCLRSAAELREFSVLYRERVGIPFQCLASPPRIAADKLEYLVQAGLYRLLMGVESGSERTKQAVYDRQISNEVVSRAARVIQRFSSVVPCFFFILGNPYEEQSDLVETLRFMAGLPYPYYVSTFNLIFFPGSALYHRAVQDGIIAGTQDSGGELYFSSGYQYKGHIWKQKNLYLNALLFLTEGKVTKFRLGLLPRFLLPLLTHPRVVGSGVSGTIAAKVLIAGKMWALFLRAKGASILRRLMRDPTGVYSLPLYLRTLLFASGRKRSGVY